jgi:hypothetical protein
MKHSAELFLFALLALAAAFIPNAVADLNAAETPQDKPAAQGEAQEPEPEYSEEEYNAYDAASKEADPAKRGAMLLEFMEKYPKSKLMSYIEAAYKGLLFECSNGKKYEQLEPLAEKWLKLHPDEIQTLAYIAEAAEKLGHDQKCVECLEAIYKLEPTPIMARNIFQTYQKMKNQAKVQEWAEKLFKMPEFESDFKLRYDFVLKYTDAKNYAKAAEYAKLTLQAADFVKEPDAETKEQLRKVRRACYHLMGMNSYEADKFGDAIKSLQQALKAEKYGEGYYYIGMSLWKQEKVEEAMLYFARAEQQGGEIAGQAKDKLEQLYKALHNNTTIGIDKVYRKAKEEVL